MGAITLLLAVAALLAPPRTTVFEMPSESMVPTVEIGGRVTATVGAYDGREVERGDIVLIHPPSVVENWDAPQCGDGGQQPGQMCAAAAPGLTDATFVRRVVGLPGDQLSLSRGHLIRNGAPVDEPFVTTCDEDCDFPVAITVPADRYFVLGDNRGSSDDSRFWGPLPKEALFARVDRIAARPPEDPHPRTMREASESMSPTLEVGAKVQLNDRAYDRADPQLNDIVVFHPPAGAEADNTCAKRPLPADEMCPRSTRGFADVRFIKRIVGLPGDRLSMRRGRVIRNGKRVSEPFVSTCEGIGCEFSRTITVPAGQYFVLGDNRGASDDSRFWGPVRRKGLEARVDRCLPQPAVGCPRRR
jgi:signal peptidase I